MFLKITISKNTKEIKNKIEENQNINNIEEKLNGESIHKINVNKVMGQIKKKRRKTESDLKIANYDSFLINKQILFYKCKICFQ